MKKIYSIILIFGVLLISLLSCKLPADRFSFGVNGTPEVGIKKDGATGDKVSDYDFEQGWKYELSKINFKYNSTSTKIPMVFTILAKGKSWKIVDQNTGKKTGDIKDTIENEVISLVIKGTEINAFKTAMTSGGKFKAFYAASVKSVSKGDDEKLGDNEEEITVTKNNNYVLIKLNSDKEGKGTGDKTLSFAINVKGFETKFNAANGVTNPAIEITKDAS